MKINDPILRRAPNHPLWKTARFAFALLFGMSGASVSAHTGELDGWSVLDHWVLATPISILMLQAFGVAAALGIIAISAYFWLIPEKDPRAGD